MLFQSHPALGRISTPQFHFRGDLCSTLVSLCFSPLQRPAALDSKVYQLFFFCLCPYKGSTRDFPGGPVAKKNLAIPTQGAKVPWIADQGTGSLMLQLKIPRATPQSQCHQLNKYLLKEKRLNEMSFYSSGVVSQFFCLKQNSLIAVTMFVKQQQTILEAK